tara:strand:- start:258 stop:422 length:165 start_codon:yes stop_codon:yes gene_type:complete
LVTIAIDYSTITTPTTAWFAKYAMDQCIEQKKEIELLIMVEKKMDASKLVKILQ